jgi:hypothetical protein
MVITPVEPTEKWREAGCGYSIVVILNQLLFRSNRSDKENITKT